MSYLVELCVHYQPGILNPEAQAIQEGAALVGADLSNLTWGKYCSYVSSQRTKKAVEDEARDICEKLFANPVMETYEILRVKKIREPRRVISSGNNKIT